MTAVAPNATSAPSGHPAHLSVDEVGVRFGGVHALAGVTFDAEPGAIVGLIGANGSGKTTTLDVISGLVTPQSGQVHIDGVDLAEYLPEERLGVGMVRSFQDCRLFPELTVLDVLLLSEDARQEVAVLPTTLRLPWARRAERRKLEAVDQVLTAFGLERFRHHRTAELSTGTRRYRAAGSRSVHPLAASAPPGCRHHDHLGGARRAPRVRALLDRRRHGAGPRGGRGGARRDPR
jgi:branched-chain amino acid transport system ATP-binding protein